MASAFSNLARVLGVLGGGNNAFTRFSDRLEDPYGERAGNRALGNILSMQSIPAFARPGGAEPDSPENIRNMQLQQLSQVGTPQALEMLGKLSPMNQSPEKLAALGQLSALIGKKYGLPAEQVNAMLMGGVEPSALGSLLKPEAQELVQTYDPATGQMVYTPKSQAAGKVSAAPTREQVPEDIARFEYEQNLKQNKPELYKAFQESMAGKRLDPEKEAAIEKDLRKEFTNLNQTFRDTTSAYKKLRSAEATPAGDISMIFGYMKMLDPASVVREGEFATAQNATGVPGQIANLYNKALEGVRLSDVQRRDFLTQAENIYNTQADTASKYSDTYKGLAERAGVDVSDVVIDFNESIRPIERVKTVFTSVKEAESANLPKGTTITINGRKAVVE